MEGLLRLCRSGQKRSVLLLLAFFLMGSVCWFSLSGETCAQVIPRVRISGRVADASTGQPLHFVNVFLSNTTLGTATGMDGRYVIENIPLGNYDLVVSMMGYEFQVREIRLTESEEKVFHFSLKPKVLEAPTVEVSAHYPREWKKNFEKFKEIFLGGSANASRCTILNPYVLDFEFDETSNLFTASASQPIQIENRALGYRVDFSLITFSFRENDFLQFEGKPKYEPLFPTDEKEKNDWEANRLEAYNGSLRHFFGCLASGQDMEKEGFRVYEASDLPGEGKTVYLTQLSFDDFVSPGEVPYEKKLGFSDYLQVVYTREYEPEEYSSARKTGGVRQTVRTRSVRQGGTVRTVTERQTSVSPTTRGERKPEQTSWMEMWGDSVVVNTLGHLDNPYSVKTYGYWAWERFAEALPLDYLPEGSMATYTTLLTPEREVFLVRPDSLFQETAEALEDVPGDPVVLIKQARSWALEGETYEATRVLYRGLETLRNHPYTDTLYYEIVDIMLPDQSETYRQASDKGRFFLGFWQRQDPTPATLENERYVEHVKRLEYIRQWYASFHPRGYDDRGMIYLRYGPPDDLVKMPTHPYLYSNECWVYRRYGGEVVFDFIQRGMSYECATDLTKIVMATPMPTDGQIYEFVAPRQRLSLGYASLAAELAGEGIQFGSVDASSGAPQETSAQRASSSVLRQLQEYNRQVLRKQNQIPPVGTSLSRSEEPLLGVSSTARFYRQRKVRLEVYYGIPLGQLRLAQLASGSRLMDLSVSYAVRDTAYNLVTQKSFQGMIELPAEERAQDRVYIDQINEVLPPGTYLFSLEVKNPQTSSVFDRTYRITVPGVTDESLLLSDVQVAADIQSLGESAANPAFVKRKLMVMPYPFSRVSRNKPVTFYFEVYNLMLDETGGSSYTVDYEFRLKKTGFWQKINPFKKRGVAVSSSYNRTGEHREAQEYFSLNFEELKPGEYTVSIAVTDEVTKTTRSSVVPLRIVE